MHKAGRIRLILKSEYLARLKLFYVEKSRLGWRFESSSKLTKARLASTTILRLYLFPPRHYTRVPVTNVFLTRTAKQLAAKRLQDSYKTRSVGRLARMRLPNLKNSRSPRSIALPAAPSDGFYYYTPVPHTRIHTWAKFR